MDDLFERPHKREIPELNLVPIIDMFTTVIFFLLLSTVFVAYTKLTVPPAKISTITEPLAPPPVSATLLVGSGSAPGRARVVVEWAGKEPGHTQTEAPTQHEPNTPSPLLEATKKLITDFHKKFPEEKTIRVALARDAEYQSLITVMDAVEQDVPDVVLVSYDEAEMRLGTLSKDASAPATGGKQ